MGEVTQLAPSPGTPITALCWRRFPQSHVDSSQGHCLAGPQLYISVSPEIPLGSLGGVSVVAPVTTEQVLSLEMLMSGTPWTSDETHISLWCGGLEPLNGQSSHRAPSQQLMTACDPSSRG